MSTMPVRALPILVLCVIGCSSPSKQEPPPKQEEAPPPKEPPPPERVAIGLSLATKVHLSTGHAIELEEYGEGASIRVNGYEARLPNLGADDSRVAWTREYRVELVAHEPGPPATVSVYVDRIADEVVTSKSVRVERHKPVDIGGGVTLEWMYTRYKRLYPGDTDIPPTLPVFELRYPDQPPIEVTARFGLAELSTWPWRNYRFELTDHSMPDFLAFDVHIQKLEPVTLGEAPKQTPDR